MKYNKYHKKYKNNPKLYKGIIFISVAILWQILGKFVGRILFSGGSDTAVQINYMSSEYFIMLIWYAILLWIGLYGTINAIWGISISLKKK